MRKGRRADRQTGRQRVRERWGSCPGKAPTTYSFLLVIPGGGGVVESCLANMLSILLLLLLLMLLIFLTSSVNHNEINTTWAVKVGVMPCPTLPCPAQSCLATPLSFQSSPVQPSPRHHRPHLTNAWPSLQLLARETPRLCTQSPASQPHGTRLARPPALSQSLSVAGGPAPAHCRTSTLPQQHYTATAVTLHCRTTTTLLGCLGRGHHHHTQAAASPLLAATEQQSYLTRTSV